MQKIIAIPTLPKKLEVRIMGSLWSAKNRGKVNNQLPNFCSLRGRLTGDGLGK